MRQDLNRQAMRLRHPTFCAGLTEDQRKMVGETADLLQRAAKDLDPSLIRIIFTDRDVMSLADELGVDKVTAFDRAHEWAKHIEETASGLCSEQLASAIAHNQP